MLLFVVKEVYLLFFSVMGYVPFQSNNIDSLPKNYFSWPVAGPVSLSGGFGEIRPNHFHNGVDIKTNEEEGWPVMAAASGFVSRIKVSAYGYGLALYITHPNGFTTVYGHLQKYNDTLNKIVEGLQLQNQSFEIDQTFLPNQLAVQKGDLVAISGNTGGSQGPHLHFEIRNTLTEWVYNPLLFGFNYVDNVAPVASQFLVYNFNDAFAFAKKTIVTNRVKTIVCNQPYIALAAVMFDYQQATKNKLGVHSAQVFYNDSLVFSYTLNTVSFENNKYVNAFSDFNEEPLDYTCLFIKPNNKLPVYSTVGNGIINLSSSASHHLKIVILDEFKNKNAYDLNVIYNSVATKPIPQNSLFNNNIASNVNTTLGILHIPAYTFYYPVPLTISNTQDTLFISPNRVAMHLPITIATPTQALLYGSKTVLLQRLFSGKRNYIVGFIKGDSTCFKISQLGTFYYTVDSTAPVIKNFTSKIEKLGLRFGLNIIDIQSGINSYNAYLNNEWVLMKYDAKLHYFFGVAPNLLSHNVLTIMAKDVVGNTVTKTITF